MVLEIQKLTDMRSAVVEMLRDPVEYAPSSSTMEGVEPMQSPTRCSTP